MRREIAYTSILTDVCARSYCINFTAQHLTNLSFLQIFLRAIAANWLVCLAVFLSASAKDIFSKIAAIFLPVWLFVTVGFEHIVANMYVHYI